MVNGGSCTPSIWDLLAEDVAMVTNLDGFWRGLDQFKEDRVINGC